MRGENGIDYYEMLGIRYLNIRIRGMIKDDLIQIAEQNFIDRDPFEVVSTGDGSSSTSQQDDQEEQAKRKSSDDDWPTFKTGYEAWKEKWGWTQK